MTLRDCAARCGFTIAVPGEGLDTEVRGGYVSDLMSDVLGHARAGFLWVTLQTHANIIAVAAARDLAGVLLIGGNLPEAETIEKAREEAVTLLLSHRPAFEVVGRLYGLGIPGTATDDEGI